MGSRDSLSNVLNVLAQDGRQFGHGRYGLVVQLPSNGGVSPGGHEHGQPLDGAAGAKELGLQGIEF
jgi:hypothetical protein